MDHAVVATAVPAANAFLRKVPGVNQDQLEAKDLQGPQDLLDQKA